MFNVFKHEFENQISSLVRDQIYAQYGVKI